MRCKKSSEVKYKGLCDYRRSGLNNVNALSLLTSVKTEDMKAAATLRYVYTRQLEEEEEIAMILSALENRLRAGFV